VQVRNFGPAFRKIAVESAVEHIVEVVAIIAEQPVMNLECGFSAPSGPTVTLIMLSYTSLCLLASAKDVQNCRNNTYGGRLVCGKIQGFSAFGSSLPTDVAILEQRSEC